MEHPLLMFRNVVIATALILCCLGSKILEACRKSYIKLRYEQYKGMSVKAHLNIMNSTYKCKTDVDIEDTERTANY